VPRKETRHDGCAHTPFWELEEPLWETFMRVGRRSHYVASRLAAPRMVARRKGLIVSTSSGGAVRYTFTCGRTTSLPS
jgi:dehydrogenase/reductase SDR family protein 1